MLVEHVDLLRRAFHVVNERQPFALDAVVILPDHLHTIMTLPMGDPDFSGRWRAIKARFTRELGKRGIRPQRDARGEYELWQRRFWEHTIRDDNDKDRHIDYLHYNPVKHGLVDQVADWPYSSFHRFVRQGLLPSDWAGGAVGADGGRFGE